MPPMTTHCVLLLCGAGCLPVIASSYVRSGTKPPDKDVLNCPARAEPHSPQRGEHYRCPNRTDLFPAHRHKNRGTRSRTGLYALLVSALSCCVLSQTLTVRCFLKVHYVPTRYIVKHKKTRFRRLKLKINFSVSTFAAYQRRSPFRLWSSYHLS